MGNTKQKYIIKGIMLTIVISILSFSVISFSGEQIETRYYSSFDEDLRNQQQLCYNFLDYYNNIDTYNISIYNYSNNDYVVFSNQNDYNGYLPQPYDDIFLDTRDGFCGSGSIGIRFIEYEINKTNFDFLINLTTEHNNEIHNQEFRAVLTNESFQIKPLEDLRILNTQNIEYQEILYNLEEYYINFDYYNLEVYDLDWNFITSGTMEDVINLESGVIDTRTDFQPENKKGFRYIEHNEDEEFEYIISIDVMGFDNWLAPDTFIFELYQDTPIDLVDINLSNYYYDKPDSDFIKQIKFTKNNKYLFVGTYNRNLFIYENNGTSFNLIKTINLNYTIRDIFLSNNDKKLYVSTSDEIRIYDIENSFNLLINKNVEYNGLSFLYNDFVYSVDTYNNDFKVRDKENLEVLNTLNIGVSNRDTTELKLKDDFVYFSSFFNDIYRFNLLTNQTELFLEQGDVIIGLEITDNYLIFATHNDIVSIYNLSDLSHLTNIDNYQITPDHSNPYNNMLDVSNGEEVLSFIGDKGIILYDLNELSIIESYPNLYNSNFKTHNTFSHDASLLSFGGTNGEIYVYKTNYISPFIHISNNFPSNFSYLNKALFEEQELRINITDYIINYNDYNINIYNEENQQILSISQGETKELLSGEIELTNKEIIYKNYSEEEEFNIRFELIITDGETTIYEDFNLILNNENTQNYKANINPISFLQQKQEIITNINIKYEEHHEDLKNYYGETTGFYELRNNGELIKNGTLNLNTTTINLGELNTSNYDLKIILNDDINYYEETFNIKIRKNLFTIPNPENATKNDLYLITTGLILSLLISFIGYKTKHKSLFNLGLFVLFLIGLTFLFSGWNILISIVLILTPLIVLFTE